MNATEPSSQPPRRWSRRRGWWIIAGVLAPAVAVVTILFVSAWVGAGRVLDVQRKSVPERVAALRAQRVLRPNLFEPAEEGNAWEMHAHALDVIGAIPHGEFEGFPSFSLDENIKPDPVRIDSALEKIRPQIEEIKRGLRRTWVEPNYSYEDHFSARIPLLPHALRTWKILADGALHRHEQGKAKEAVDFIMIGLGLTDHLGVKGPLVQGLVGFVGRGVMYEALRKIMATHDFDAASLQRLAGALDALDSAEPDFNDCLRRADLFVRIMILDVIDQQLKRSGPFAVGASYRHWFSLRIMLAELVQAQDRYMEGLERVANLPIWKRAAASENLISEFQKDPTAIHAMLLPQLGRAWRNAATCSMQSLLARMAVALALYELENGAYPAKLEDLAPKHLPKVRIDPFAGEPFGFLVKDGAAIIYSLGDDRDDDGGRPIPDEDIDNRYADGDIVWTVKRRK